MRVHVQGQSPAAKKSPGSGPGKSIVKKDKAKKKPDKKKTEPPPKKSMEDLDAELTAYTSARGADEAEAAAEPAAE